MAIAADICVYTNRQPSSRDADSNRSCRHAPLTPASAGIVTMITFSPREIVSELDRFIVGQNDAKRAVAIALRNRWRRQQLTGPSARGGAAEEHPDDRPDRLRQDRDFPPSRQARRRAVPEGRGHEVHRGRLCRPRRRADRARSRGGRHRPRARGQAQGRAGQAPRRRRRSACSTRWSGPASSPATRDSFRKKLRGQRTRRQGNRDRSAAGLERHAHVRAAQHAGRVGRRDLTSATSSARPWAGAPRRVALR